MREGSLLLPDPVVQVTLQLAYASIHLRAGYLPPVELLLQGHDALIILCLQRDDIPVILFLRRDDLGVAEAAPPVIPAIVVTTVIVAAVAIMRVAPAIIVILCPGRRLRNRRQQHPGKQELSQNHSHAH
jgi:hypothetical protein